MKMEKHLQNSKGLLLNLLHGGADLALVHLRGESQGVEGLREALLPRRDVDEHERLGVAAERALQVMLSFYSTGVRFF